MRLGRCKEDQLYGGDGLGGKSKEKPPRHSGECRGDWGGSGGEGCCQRIERVKGGWTRVSHGAPVIDNELAFDAWVGEEGCGTPVSESKS